MPANQVPFEARAGASRLATRLRDAVRGRGDMPDPAEEARLASGLRAGQLAETIKLAHYSAWTHVVVGATIVALFWRRASHLYLIGLFLVLLAVVVAALGGARWCRSRAHDPGSVDLGVRVSAWLAFVLGTAWASMPVVLFGPSDGDGRLLVATTAAGLISDAFVISPISRIPVLFAVPLVTGSFAALAITGQAVCVGLAVLLLIYASFVLCSSSRMSRLSSERILDKLRVEQQNGTINLLLREFEEGTSDWLWEVDAQLRLQHVSERLAQAARRPRDELTGLPLHALLAPGAAPDGAAEPDALAPLFASRAAFRDALVYLWIGGQARWWSLTGKPVHDAQGCFAGYRGVASDVTAARVSEARITQLATCDVLTGLANRAVLQDALRLLCDQAGRGGPGGTLLYADLDGFKEVNDTLGHLAGDRLLQQVAARLRDCAGARATVARLGGDEFAVLVAAGDVPDPARLASLILDSLSRPYDVEGVTAKVGVSLGIARSPGDAVEAQALLQCADLALYRAKAEGKAAYRIYDQDLGDKVRDRQALQNDLRHALSRGEFEVHYQPIICLDGGGIGGCEALLRWRHPTRGGVSPAEFIPLAEAQGLIVPLGRWVLATACAEAAGWTEGRRVAVNLSPMQFRDPELLDQVRAVLARTGLAPERLELEITESVLLEATDATLDLLHALRGLGVRIALDDFGTGYSSLSYLLKFPFDKVKIDRAFVRELGRREDCAAIIDAVIGLAGRIGMEVTAEGVETAEQALSLRTRRCGHLQGFLFSAARPPAVLREVMAAWAPFGNQLDADGSHPATGRIQGAGAKQIDADARAEVVA